VFEMAVPIQSPAKCEVRSIIRFLNARGERPAEIHNHFVAVYGNVMNWQNVTKWCHEFSEGSSMTMMRCMSHDMVQRAGGRLLRLGDKEAGSNT